LTALLTMRGKLRLAFYRALHPYNALTSAKQRMQNASSKVYTSTSKKTSDSLTLPSTLPELLKKKTPAPTVDRAVTVGGFSAPTSLPVGGPTAPATPFHCSMQGWAQYTPAAAIGQTGERIGVRFTSGANLPESWQVHRECHTRRPQAANRALDTLAAAFGKVAWVTEFT
jgi:hypothetical protein